MTAFFVADMEGESKRSEAAYNELRERSEIVVGCPAKSRRIFKLNCRFDGRDCEIEVGRQLAQGSNVVAAILDHGRDEAYMVHTVGDRATAVRVGRPVYAVTEFS